MKTDRNESIRKALETEKVPQLPFNFTSRTLHKIEEMQAERERKFNRLTQILLLITGTLMYVAGIAYLIFSCGDALLNLMQQTAASMTISDNPAIASVVAGLLLLPPLFFLVRRRILKD